MVPWLKISDTTPLVTNVDFVNVDASPPPSVHSLAPPAGDLILGQLPLPQATVT